jgi:hypothetical protein
MEVSTVGILVLVRQSDLGFYSFSVLVLLICGGMLARSFHSTHRRTLSTVQIGFGMLTLLVKV